MMKERLAEDWLSRINERGFDVAFCQTLLSKGQRVLRAGHSPTEHGKDVITRSADGTDVWAYQLKTGNFSQADILKHHDQLNMLVETRPILSGLGEKFAYHPVLVTTGEFKEPAASLIKEYNASWKLRGLPELRIVGGRELLADFLALSTDFWPVGAPALHEFRSLYLAEGKGDFDPEKFSSVIIRVMTAPVAAKNLARQAAAANLFSSYLLGEFMLHGDHWNVFRGWTVCAAAIAYAGESAPEERSGWQEPFALAQEAAMSSLRALIDEARDDEIFRCGGMELDDYTRVRNLVTLAAVACGLLVAKHSGVELPDTKPLLDRMEDFAARGRFLFWGEGALSQYMMIIWALESGGRPVQARILLNEAIMLSASRNHPENDEPLADAYRTPDECLMALISETVESETKTAIESRILYPLVLLGVRRHMRTELESRWPEITKVRLSWFRADARVDVLRWVCERGREITMHFASPQKWSDLSVIAAREDRDRLPDILWNNHGFAFMYILAYQHRMLASLYKRLDSIVEMKTVA